MHGVQGAFRLTAELGRRLPKPRSKVTAAGQLLPPPKGFMEKSRKWTFGARVRTKPRAGAQRAGRGSAEAGGGAARRENPREAREGPLVTASDWPGCGGF